MGMTDLEKAQQDNIANGVNAVNLIVWEMRNQIAALLSKVDALSAKVDGDKPQPPLNG